MNYYHVTLYTDIIINFIVFMGKALCSGRGGVVKLQNMQHDIHKTIIVFLPLTIASGNLGYH